MVKSFLEAIQWFFVDFLFAPFDYLRNLELSNWWSANFINWIFIVICCVAMWYWLQQLRIFEANEEDEDNTTSHSFLG